MKKLITTSIVLVSVASISGVAIGMSLNRPTTKPIDTQLITRTTAVSRPAAATPTQTAPQPTSVKPSTPTQTASVAPVTVAAYKQIPLDNQGNIDCEYTYSDGTTYQWHWQTYIPQYQWVVSRNGVGTWESTTQTLNSCDDSVLGTTK